MKLNLLPTYVSKEKQAKTGVILGVLTAVVGIAAAVGMIVISKNGRDSAYASMEEKRPAHLQVLAISKAADTVITQAKPIITNINLAEAMNAHNTVYADLFDQIRQYIPSFFRLTAISATPLSADGASVNLTGVIQTQQQYADLMLALLRIPGAANVSRDGYQVVSAQVPALSVDDQSGRPLKPGEGRIPDDPEQRLNYYIAQGQLTGFMNVSGFGGEAGPRGPMPDWSTVNITILMPAKLMTPNPRATLASGGGAPAPGAPAAPAPPPPGGGGERENN
jgi:Tfp pilus assembly protein PilN